MIEPSRSRFRVRQLPSVRKSFREPDVDEKAIRCASCSKHVPLSSTVTATFNENSDMDGNTLNTTNMKLVDTKTSKKVGASVTYDSGTNSGTKTATLTPTSPLTANRKYQATITTGAKDLAGNGLAKNYTWTFTTGN